MVTVRPARPDEQSAILALHQTSIRAFGPDAYAPRQVHAWAEKDEPDYPIDDDDHRFVVAERTGELAGFGDLDCSAAEITAVYVHPDHTRTGAGTAMLKDLEAAARRHGIEQLGLLASKNAVGFYADAGYERVEKRLHETGGATLECVWRRNGSNNACPAPGPRYPWMPIASICS